MVTPAVPEGDGRLECALCKAQVAKLQDSHLMPAGLYKLLRDTESPGPPDPIIVGGGKSMPSSVQVSQPLLCAACERRFGQHESWMLSHCARPQRFLLREKLAGAPTLRLPGREVLVYDLDIAYPEAAAHLAYFAASVFWRSAATKWRHGSRVIGSIRLGPYGEGFRRYLCNDTEFPATAALSVFVDARPSPDRSLNFPFSGRSGLAARHIFSIPGVRFVLFVGKGVAPENLLGAINTGGPKAVFLEDFSHSSFQRWQLNLVQLSPPSRRLRERLDG